MEKTRLNLSVPLLSVRRINSNIRQTEGVNRKNLENSQPNRQKSLCVAKSDCELSEVTKPVAVPFCWEQAPGKRIGENGGGGKVYPCEGPTTTPRLPPGRKPDSRRFYYSCERSDHEDSFRFQTEALGLKDHAALLDGLVESMHAKGEFDVERKPNSVEKYEPNILSYYSDYAEDVVTENEDEVSDNNVTTDQHKRSRKFWKLFPRLSVKSSLRLLNPFPGTKSKSQAPTSSTNEVKRMTRNAPSGPLNNARKAYSGPLEKQNYGAIYKQRFRPGALSGELCKAEKRSMSNQYYPNWGSRSGAISPYRNVTPSSRFNEGTGFLGVPREAENLKASMFSSFREVDYGRGGLDSPSNVVEKTVYVDSVNYVKTSKPKGVMDSVENLTTMTTRIVEQTSSAAKSSSCNIEPNREKFKPDYRSYSDVNSSQSPYPPLPKSPSESWLCRTLPSITSRSHNDQTNRSPRATKREITVNPCNEHHSSSYYSEELVPYGSQIW